MKQQKKISAIDVSSRNAAETQTENKGGTPEICIGHPDCESSVTSGCEATVEGLEQHAVEAPRIDSYDIHSRLFGARVAAGFVSNAEGAELHEMVELEHEHIEAGICAVEQHMVEKAAHAYGVTEDFLLQGRISTNADAFAARIADLHREHRALMDELNADPVSGTFDSYWHNFFLRFHELRRAAGHPTIASAVASYGWKHRTYFDHETGGQMVSLDRLIGYCLAMGGRPEFVVLGQYPIAESNETVWQERSISEIDGMHYSAPLR